MFELRNRYEAIVSAFEKIIKWWRKRNCKHIWHPALKETDHPTGFPLIVRRVSKPVRVCRKCEAVEVLTQPEFYAQFGRMPW